LDTGKKVDPLRCANPRILKKVGSGTASLEEALFCLSPPDLNFFYALYKAIPTQKMISGILYNRPFNINKLCGIRKNDIESTDNISTKLFL